MGLSLWIVPEPATAEKLQRVMNIRPTGYDATRSYTGSERVNKSYPKFYPHITLASLPEAMEHDLNAVTAALPVKHFPSESPIESSTSDPTSPTPIFCKFAALESGDVYYRSVYVSIALPESQSPGLAALHAQVHSKLGIPVKTPAFPHMSLVYIDEGDGEDGGEGGNGGASKAERKRYYDTLVSRGIWKDADDGSLFGLDVSVASESVDGGGSTERGVATSECVDGFVAHEIWAVRCVGPVEGWVVLKHWSL